MGYSPWSHEELDMTGQLGVHAFARQRGPHGLMPSKMCPNLEGLVRCFTVMIQRVLICLWTFFWLVGGEVSQIEHLQPSCSWAWVYGLVGIMLLISPTWWRFQYLQNGSKIVMCIPWGGTRTLVQGWTIVSFDNPSLISSSPPFPI